MSKGTVPEQCPYDIFLSHSAKDKEVVCTVAERLRADGVRVWLDEWEIRPGDSIPAKIEDGLEHSRVLACPAVAFERRRKADTSGRELPSCDPLNQERTFHGLWRWLKSEPISFKN
jgi:hypothetical protein